MGVAGKILVVDDEPDFLVMLGKIIGLAGYHIKHALNGQEGLAIAQAWHPDLIITDWMMPVMDGAVLCRCIKDDPDLRMTYVIMLTAKNTTDDLVHGLDVGADDYLTKPMERAELLARVRAGLRISYLQRELSEHLAEIAQERAQLSAILTNMAEPLIVTDAAGMIIALNPAAQRIFLLTGRMMKGEPVSALGNDELTQLFARAMTSTDTWESVSGEVRLGGDQTSIARLAPVSDANWQRTGWVANLHDVTHFKELDRAKSEAVAQVAHDIKSPLMTIYGFAEVLSLSAALNEDERDAADRIRHSVRFIRTLVDNLLDLERIESGLSLDEECDLGLLASSAQEEVGLQATQKNVKIVPSITRNLPPILGDPTYLRQAIVNLLTNAVKYSPEGSRVRLMVDWWSDNALVVSVADKGPGIPPESLARLFERFYRVPGQEKHSGTGLGLTIVKSVAEAHGGCAWVESQLGKGSVFYISVPVPAEAMPKERRPRKRATSSVSSNGELMLHDELVRSSGVRSQRTRRPRVLVSPALT
jgi:two-component system, OmpR family, phosphate regulon sensor histidine kinase PhoR